MRRSSPFRAPWSGDARPSSLRCRPRPTDRWCRVRRSLSCAAARTAQCRAAERRAAARPRQPVRSWVAPRGCRRRSRRQRPQLPLRPSGELVADRADHAGFVLARLRIAATATATATTAAARTAFAVLALVGPGFGVAVVFAGLVAFVSFADLFDAFGNKRLLAIFAHCTSFGGFTRLARPPTAAAAATLAAFAFAFAGLAALILGEADGLIGLDLGFEIVAVVILGLVQRRRGGGDLRGEQRLGSLEACGPARRGRSRTTAGR